MSVTIYSYPDNYRVWKSQIAAQFNEVKVELPAFNFETDLKSPEFLAKFPNAKVPACDTPFGPLYESGAIMKYIARLRADTGLFGSNFYEAALVEQWIDWSTFELEPARGAWIYPVWGIVDANPRITAEAKRDVQRALGQLDAHLLKETYLVGNTVTLADIVVATAFVDLIRNVLVAKDTAAFKNFNRWFNTLINLDQFKAVLGDVAQAATEAPAKKAAKPEVAGGGEQKKAKKEGEGKKESKKEAKKEKKEETKKEAKKEAKKDEKKGGKDEDLSHLLNDDDAPVEKKAKSALDLLPKSPMILDACKKLMFTEKPFNPNFFNTLWNGSDEVTKFDPAGYSVYSCEYKYNDEHKVYFLTCNLMGGFIQRSEGVRKYAFGVLNLTGASDESPPWRLSGVWIFRGPGIPAEMTAVDDSEHFTWEKLDTSNPAARALITEAFTGTTVQGQNVLEQRYFK